MNNFNSVLIEGIVENEPAITVSEKGSLICTFTLISKRLFKEDDTSQEKTLKIAIETWARLAEICRQRCTKRCVVRVVGWLKQNAADGKIKVIAEHIEFKPIAKIEEE